MSHDIITGLLMLALVVGALAVVLAVGIGICLFEENTQRKWPSS